MSLQPKTHILKNFPIRIDLRAAQRHLGYKPSSKINDRIVKMFDEAVARSIELSNPAGIYFIDRIISRNENCVTLECGFSIESKLVSKMMNNCGEMMVFAATIGGGPEREAAKQMSDNPAEALLLDAVAGEAAEGAVEYLHVHVQRDAHRRGLHLTPRFSPGYGDWTLEAQPGLFRFLRPEKIGIELTESCMMIPRKSVSGIVGLGPLPGIRTGASPCKSCSNNLNDRGAESENE